VEKKPEINGSSGTCNINLYDLTKHSGLFLSNFKHNFNFRYIENLVEVVDLKIETDDKVIILQETGSGLGMVEDTSGFVI